MKIYILSFWSGDANTYLLSGDEVYSTLEKAEARKKEYFEKATEDRNDPNYDSFCTGDWYTEDRQGIIIEEVEIH